MRILILMLSTAFSIVVNADTDETTAISPSEQHYFDVSLEELLDIPLDRNTVNILESHIHQEDEWMVGYNYQFIDMKGNRSDDSQISPKKVLNQFKVTPTSMTMAMHMATLMYAPTDDITLMFMLPYKKLTMQHITRSKKRFSTRSEGVGDVKLMANFVLFRSPWDQHIVSLNTGISFPTGSVDERDDTPAGPKQLLPYPMQLGSGTYDLLPGISYSGLSRDWGWGMQVNGTIRIGRNEHQYRLGDNAEVSGWLTYVWSNWISTSLRLKSQWWDDIHGNDPRLDPTVVPTADPDLRAGKRVNLLLAIELYAPDGTLKGQHLGIEFGAPVYQHLDGPQLEKDWQINAGWQWTY